MCVSSQLAVTVLVVEDDESLRMLCRINLELENYRVLEAETVERATALVLAEPIDVVLLDLHVGERHGTELLPILRAERPDAQERRDPAAAPPRVDGLHAGRALAFHCR